MQLDPHALLALSRPLLEGFERDFTPWLWHGLRLLAIDGSTARLPNTDDAEHRRCDGNLRCAT